MITQNEVYDMAMKTALHIMATPRAGDVVTKLERLILDAYERGMHDAFQAAGKAIGIEPMKVSANA